MMSQLHFHMDPSCSEVRRMFNYKARHIHSQYNHRFEGRIFMFLIINYIIFIKFICGFNFPVFYCFYFLLYLMWIAINVDCNLYSECCMSHSLRDKFTKCMVKKSYGCNVAQKVHVVHCIPLFCAVSHNNLHKNNNSSLAQ